MPKEINNIENIKVGDKVLVKSCYERIAIVEKITKGYIFAEGIKYSRKTGYTTIGWDKWRICLATEEDILRVDRENKRREMAYKLSDVRWRDAPFEVVSKVYNIVFNI